MANINIASGSPDRFGFEWTVYNKILPIYEEQFKRWTTLIPKEEWKDKVFLDVGCGTGRNSYWPLLYGAKEAVAIDINEGSLQSARKNLSAFTNAHIQSISAYDIPYKNKFDIVFSIGVIHHLEYPEQALYKLVEATKPGGTVLIWVYGYENNEWIVNYFNPIRKFLFSKLPINITHFLSIIPTTFLYLLIKMGLGKIEYFKLIKQFSFWHLRSIVFDQMLPHIANYWKQEEVHQLMNQAGLKEIKLHQVNGMSWCAIGKKDNSCNLE